MPKYFFYLLILLFFLTGCQSVKEGLSGSKQKNSDEFLVEKKNPLVLPPEFEELPEPETLNNKVEDYSDEEIELEKLFDKIESTNKEQSTSQTNNDSLEKFILKKIKNN